MATRVSFVLMLAAALLLSVTPALAEGIPGEQKTFRTVCAVGGIIGGALVGWGIGLAATDRYEGAGGGAVVGTVGGGVGGYFLGRMIDKNQARNRQVKPQQLGPSKPSQQRINEAQARAMDVVAKQFAARLRPPSSKPAEEK